MGINDHQSNSPSPPREREDACQVTDESPAKFFVIGKKLLFSPSSVFLSGEDVKSLETDVAKLDEECSPPKNGDGESEAEAATSPESSRSPDAEPKSAEKQEPQWKGLGFMRKLTLKGPTLPQLPSFARMSKRRFSRDEEMPKIPTNLEAELYYCFQNSWTNFTLSELKEGTDNFNRENMIGEGGYSEVYKGHLVDGQLVAIKRLIRGTTDEMTADYLSELGILIHVNHPNIASVIGYCIEGGMHLVLPLSANGSLSSLLKDGKEKLTWTLRYNIALGIASGLSYLHEGCQRRIIHRDIKSANILLTEDFEPKISDFGLAKWLPDQWTHLTASHFEGTFGYLPPELFMHGMVDEKTDVYAFGVLLLEIITSRPALDEASNSLVMWAKPLLNNKNVAELVDPTLDGDYDSEQLDRVATVASLCIDPDPAERPKMSQALRMLKEEKGNVAPGKTKFQRRAALKKTSFEVIHEEETTSHNKDGTPESGVVSD